jgi:XFP C-terminal domain
MGFWIGNSTRCLLLIGPSFSVFMAYPTLIHRLTYRRQNHENFHVRGSK